MFQLIPKGLFSGFNCSRNGVALYWNRRMDDPIWGQYRPRRTNIEMGTRFHNFCNDMMIGISDVILVKVEVRELGIALEVEKIGF